MEQANLHSTYEDLKWSEILEVVKGDIEVKSHNLAAQYNTILIVFIKFCQFITICFLKCWLFSPSEPMSTLRATPLSIIPSTFL